MGSEAKLPKPATLPFEFTITYFDVRGRFTLQTHYEFRCRYITDGVVSHPDMNHLAQHVRGLLHTGGRQGMPGGVDEGWEGYVLLSHPSSTPLLILAKSTP